MKRLFVLSLLTLASASVLAVELSGNVAAELQLFPQSSQFESQLDENLTLSFKPKMTHAWNKGNDELTVELFPFTLVCPSMPNKHKACQ